MFKSHKAKFPKFNVLLAKDRYYVIITFKINIENETNFSQFISVDVNEFLRNLRLNFRKVMKIEAVAK